MRGNPLGIGQAKRIGLLKTLLVARAIPSKGEGRRLLRDRAIDVDDQPITSFDVELKVGSLIRVGKHRYFHLVEGEVEREEIPAPVPMWDRQDRISEQALETGRRIHRELVEWYKANAPEWLPGGRYYEEYLQGFHPTV